MSSIPLFLAAQAVQAPVASVPITSAPITSVPMSPVPAQQTLPIADIHLPAAVSAWPPAIGWWLLLVLVIALCAGSVYAIKRYQKKWRYRRAALQLLKQQYQQWQQDNDGLHCATAMIATMKRTAITAYSEDSAALYGQSWIDFLNQQTSKAYFSDSLAQWMSDQQYQAQSTQQTSDNSIDIPQLYSACTSWIKQHDIKQYDSEKTTLGGST